MTADVLSIGGSKGGTGKTTTAQNLSVKYKPVHIEQLPDMQLRAEHKQLLAAQYQAQGKRVLGIDADGQGSWSHLNGLFPKKGRPNLYTALSKFLVSFEAKIPIYHLPSGLHFIPSSSALHKIIIDLIHADRREYILRQFLAPLLDRYDIIIIDCPPALNLWTTNIFVASTEIIITVQIEPLGIASAGEMLEYLQGLQKRGVFDHDLRIAGALMTMIDPRTVLHRELAKVAEQELGKHMRFFETRIERTIQFPESQYFGQTIQDYNAESKGSTAYQALADEVLSKKRQVRVADLKVPAGFADQLIIEVSSVEEQTGEGGTELTWEEIDVHV
jgi:chromosome partitioning protein